MSADVLAAPAPCASLSAGLATLAPPAGSASGPAPSADAVRADPRGSLPAAGNVLAVIARPGQESADLGAVLSVFRLRGARLGVLCLTRGEASELNGTCGRLESVRPWELQAAAELLRVSSVSVADYPDSRLEYVPVDRVAEHILRAARRHGADLLLVVDPSAAADADTVAVARAACVAASRGGPPVLARTLDGPGARWQLDLGPDAQAIRALQRCAVDAHVSQRAAHPGIHRLLDLRADRELVRWLSPPPAEPRDIAPAGGQRVRVPQPAAAV